jgi:hypothetical protein
MKSPYLEKVKLPEGQSGKWKVQKFTIDATGAMLSAFHYIGRAAKPGDYTRLICEGRGIIMSDTPAEQLDHLNAVRNAKGSCLINGLGIGMVLKNILLKKEVTDVTVIELEQDVIDLVAPTYLKDKRVTIINASAYDYKPPKGKRYGMVWHDIWDTISTDNLPEMGRLHRKYGRIADWQDSWAKYECQRERRKDREREEITSMFASLRRGIDLSGKGLEGIKT